MDKSSLLLVVTLGLLAVFAAIVVRTYSPKRKEEAERPKHRMLEED